MTPVATRADSVVKNAVDVAREALAADVGADAVGDHAGFVAEGERLGAHYFECTLPGYPGWRWAVTLSRATRQKAATVVDAVLLPTDAAVVAPAWVPYRERIKPGDLSPGDLLPVEEDDPRLVPTYSFGDDPLDTDEKAQIRAVAKDLGLGRSRTLSPEGRDLAAERWYDSDRGPESPLAKSAPATCWSCGFLVRLNGPLSELFGVCANGDANDDGGVVSLDHGCGAHSEVSLKKRHQPQALPEHVLDTVDDLERW